MCEIEDDEDTEYTITRELLHESLKKTIDETYKSLPITINYTSIGNKIVKMSTKE